MDPIDKFDALMDEVDELQEKLDGAYQAALPFIAAAKEALEGA